MKTTADEAAGEAVHFIGLMSGTSQDGVDAALVSFGEGGGAGRPEWSLLAFESFPFSDE